MKLLVSISIIVSLLYVLIAYLPDYFTRDFMLSKASGLGRGVRILLIMSPLLFLFLAFFVGFITGFINAAIEPEHAINYKDIDFGSLAGIMFSMIIILGPASVIIELVINKRSGSIVRLFIFSILFILAMPFMMSTLYLSVSSVNDSYDISTPLTEHGFQISERDLSASCDLTPKNEDEIETDRLRKLTRLHFNQVLNGLTLGVWRIMNCGMSTLEARSDSPLALLSMWLTPLLTVLIMAGNVTGVIRRVRRQ